MNTLFADFLNFFVYIIAVTLGNFVGDFKNRIFVYEGRMKRK